MKFDIPLTKEPKPNQTKLDQVKSHIPQTYNIVSTACRYLTMFYLYDLDNIIGRYFMVFVINQAATLEIL